MSFLADSTRSVRRFFRQTPYRYTISGAIILVLAIVIALHIINNRTVAAPAVASQIAHVTLASVASLSSDTSALPVTGTVSSLHQATILAQSAGAVTGVYVSIGSSVSAGQILARLENSSQSAAVVQAKGAYDGAQAALAKASGTTAQNSSITASQAGISAQNALASANAALASAFSSLDDAVHTKSDALFSNPRSTSPMLVGITSPDSQLSVTVQNERSSIDATLADAQRHADGSDAASIEADIAGMTADAQTVSTYVDNLVRLVNQAVPNQNVNAAAIAGFQASLGAARSEVVGTLSALTAAKNAYDAASSSATTASNTAANGTASDIAVAKANVEQALGALDAAESNLEKTIIRSPLTGTIVNLPIKQGDYLTAFGTAAIVSNASALEVITHVTASDAKTLAVGGKAAIGNNAAGVITSVAPALDPTTNEIEVHIGITSGASNLTDGESVTVNLTRTNTAGSGTPTSDAPASITIPIVALKITPSGPVVFTVSASSTLVAHPVTLGPILGDHVGVVSGITPDMTIVQDARGHVAGDTVVVDAK